MSWVQAALLLLAARAILSLVRDSIRHRDRGNRILFAIGLAYALACVGFTIMIWKELP